MAFVKVAAMSELPPGTVIEAVVAGKPFAICNVQGGLHALDGTCPHSGGPLGQGTVNGDSVTCPWHAWDFNCRTGENDHDGRKKVAVFTVKEDGGLVFIDIAAAPLNA